MTVRLGDGAILLEGACLIEDAAPLLDLMLAHPGLPVDLDECIQSTIPSGVMTRNSLEKSSAPPRMPATAICMRGRSSGCIAEKKVAVGTPSAAASGSRP